MQVCTPHLHGMLGLLLASAVIGSAADTRQSTGVKVGEVTPNTALVWMRVTANAARNADGEKFDRRAEGRLPDGADPAGFHGACPGSAGLVRLTYSKQADLAEATVTDWVTVKPEHDYTHQFALTGLQPATTYYYRAETADEKLRPHDSLAGSFRTAPDAGHPERVFFTHITCLGYRDVDHADGYQIFEAMAQLKPQFCIANGDNVYYDSDAPLATSVPLARYHWQRLHSLPRHLAFHLTTPGYWLKDDHDTWLNDCWPGWNNKKMAPFTFDEGRAVFQEQVPIGEKTYRTVRWGKDLQLWFVEGRDFRSPNTMADGPAKSVWGPEQKQWLQSTLKSSDATWKLLVSPTPILGPDRANKGDNHSNQAFAHEGQEFRSWVRDNLDDNLFVLCGDRHWQYHSFQPSTGLHEFCPGPAGDDHASGTPGEDALLHKFHRVKGGFLSVEVSRKQDQGVLLFKHHDVQGETVHEHRAVRPLRGRYKPYR